MMQNKQQSFSILLGGLGVFIASVALLICVLQNSPQKKELNLTSEETTGIQKEQMDLLVAITVHSIFDDAFIRLDQYYEPYGDQVKATTEGPIWYKDGAGQFTHSVTVSEDSFLTIEDFKSFIHYALIRQLEKTKDYFPEKYQWVITEEFREGTGPEENRKRYTAFVNLTLAEK